MYHVKSDFDLKVYLFSYLLPLIKVKKSNERKQREAQVSCWIPDTFSAQRQSREENMLQVSLNIGVLIARKTNGIKRKTLNITLYHQLRKGNGIIN